jgi:hypothetical protein
VVVAKLSAVGSGCVLRLFVLFRGSEQDSVLLLLPSHSSKLKHEFEAMDGSSTDLETSESILHKS